MIDFLTKWTQNIIVALIITVLIELILPEGSSKKYIKIVLGLYVFSVVILPIIGNKTNYIEELSKDSDNYKISSMDSMKFDIDKSVEKVYKDNLSREINKYLENNGFKVIKLDLQIETEDENRFGILNKIEMTLTSNNTKEIKFIEEVKIKNTDGVNMERGKQITIFESIEEYLHNNYGVDKKNIIINTE